MSIPRLVYRGPANSTASTKRCETQEALDAALKDGWRLRRVPDGEAPEPEPAPEPVVAPVVVPPVVNTWVKAAETLVDAVKKRGRPRKDHHK